MAFRRMHLKNNPGFFQNGAHVCIVECNCEETGEYIAYSWAQIINHFAIILLLSQLFNIHDVAV